MKKPLLKHFLVVFVGVIATVYAVLNLAAYTPYLSSPYIVEDDQRQHLLPAYASAYPEDFKEGFLANYAGNYLPPGYTALMRFASVLGDPLFFCKIMGMCLLMGTYAIGFALGCSIAGPICGFLTMMLVIHSGAIESSTFNGLFRSFCFPLAMLFLLGLIQKRHWVALAALLMSALFYPPVFLICGLAFALLVVLQAPAFLREHRRLLIAGAAAGLIGIAAVGVFVGNSAAFGKTFSKKEAMQMPEWGKQDGRLREFPWNTSGEDIRQFMRGGLEANFWGRTFFPKLAATAAENRNVLPFVWVGLFGLAIVMRPRKLWFVTFLAAGLILFFISRNNAFRFGWPDRYLLYSLPPAMILLFPMAWRAARELPAWWRRSWRATGLAVWCGVFLVTPWGLGGPGENILDLSHMKAEWTAAGAMPQGALFAGWPYDMDNLPLMSRKEPFIDYEHAFPLYKDYYAGVTERLTDNLRLIFATDIAAVRAITLKYGLTHILLQRATLTHEGRTPGIFAPFNNMAAAMRRGSMPERFVFNHVPFEAVPYNGRDYFIVDLKKWLAIEAQKPETKIE